MPVSAANGRDETTEDYRRTDHSYPHSESNLRHFFFPIHSPRGTSFLQKSIELSWLHTFTTTPNPLIPQTDYKMPNWLHSVADIIAITIALVSESWRGFLGLALVVIAWLAIDWRKVYGVFHLGTQMQRLQAERRTLVDQVLPDKYPDLTPTTRAWAEDVIQRSVTNHLKLYARQLLIIVLSSLTTAVDTCQARHRALLTLHVGWLQFAAEVFSLYIAVHATLRRLHKIRREIEVRHFNLVLFGQLALKS
jgi:hypothetical protein